ncbi:hypothetical protein ACFXKI_01080 [Streptomyces mirabilis]|uniref:hypothetical protein n=1 Tax=Streptomyces mirabilis TaxID=68239 RepID=UPI0036A6BAC3
MSEIADFLRAMLGQDKARQLDIWEQWHHKDCEAVPQVLYPDRETGSCDCGVPARAIADCDAKLALIDEIEPPEQPREPETDSQLHARFAHPAWEYRTTDGPRKQWDDIDLPPHDDYGEPEPGWERNVDAGRDGWERFDYTEESYWRRLRADGPRSPYIPRELRILAQPFAGQPGHKGEEWAP